MGKKRIRDYGITPGVMETGALNKITDVPGVLVGHATVKNDTSRTGVTVIVPGPGNVFAEKFIAAAYVHNGYGKTCGLVQVEELGTLETPVALTNTMNVGLVADALVEYTIRQCGKNGVRALSVNPVVGECNDSRINNITHRAVSMEHVMEAFDAACVDFEEGDVGAGAGTVCYGLKGGIGSASRIVEIGGRTYTLGALVQSNFGATEDFVIEGDRMGARILEEKALRDKMAVAEQDQGSIMTVIATDLPLTDRQLKRIIRRAGVGIARTGAYMGHGSGEVMIGFTTAGRIKSQSDGGLLTQTFIREELINRAFKAAAEAVDEAILNSMAAAERAKGLNGEIYYSLSEFMV